MKIQELIGLIEAKLTSLQTSYTLSSSSGNVDETFRLEAEIEETRLTLENLKSLV